MKYSLELVAWLEKGLRECETWEPFMGKLTREELRSIATGTKDSILRPLKPEWPAGVEIEVASGLWIKPHMPIKANKGYRVYFDVRDWRPRLLRRVPQMLATPDFDSYGDPIPPTQDAIERARLDGSYTSSPRLAVADAGEAVDPVSQARFTADAHARRLAQPGRREEDIRQRIRSLTTRYRQELFAQRADPGITAQLDLLEAQLRELERQRRNAA
jgi:hypothetical protein